MFHVIMAYTLYSPYQTDGVAWMIQREKCDTPFHGSVVKGGILADEVGLGKTLQTIALIDKHRLENTLIIVPKSLQTQWLSEFQKFLPSQKIKTDLDTSDDTNVIIISSSHFNKKNADMYNSAFHQTKWDRVIIDEAHCIKNNKSKIHKAIAALNTVIRWCLTATPIMNKMTDFVNTMEFLGISKLISQQYKNETSKQFILRRSKEDVKEFDVSFDLPTCTIETVRIPFVSQEEKDLYKEVYTKTEKKMKKTDNPIEALEMLLRVRQICACPQSYIDGISKKMKTKLSDWKYGNTKVDSIQKIYSEECNNDKVLIS
jgi:transcription termination factor 2